ncbi:SAF domain-containing protein [Nocardia terpenica]|uniref:Flagellar biosynthesis protein FlgA n=1 Tax=Nocardia terpenica TaxID=455432 RepID=A0A291RTZ0_9NOCA|nr:SAF domain-containing protein [Nocardia terpenica]ATL70694.1 flagellar biosynthesis protein FlgA [Nocardia terpenica]
MKRLRLDADLGREPLREPLTRHRPAWADATLARRLLAAALVILAAVLVVRGDPTARHVEVVVAARDLAPGRVLHADDLRRVSRTAGTVPGGAVHAESAVLGATLAGAVRGGEILTDLRVVGPRLAAVAAGVPEARIVPIKPADNAIADILRAGDRVDVVAAEESSPGDSARAGPPRILATDAAVVLVAGGEKERGATERVVLVALDSAHAVTVAGASLRSALTVVFH